MEHIAVLKEKLFDGQDEGFYSFSHKFHLPQEIIIYERDFRKNYFDDLEKIMNADEFSQLMREGVFIKPIGPFGNYLGSDNLSLNYCIINGLLFIFASGEYQPTRYKIYLEGVWRLR